MAIIRLTLKQKPYQSSPGFSSWVDWDPEKGTIAGPSKTVEEFMSQIKSWRQANGNMATFNDHVWNHDYLPGKEPLKSYTDMAALIYDIGWVLPDFMEQHFPYATEEQQRIRDEMEAAGVNF